MSASKLLIHKFETGGNIIKSLQVTTEDEGNDNFTAKYSEWLDGKIQEKKKDKDKSSRLIVKIVSGNNIDRFNLDSTAKKIDITDENLANYTKYSLTHKPWHILNQLDGDQKDNANFCNEGTVNIMSSQAKGPPYNDESVLQYYLQDKHNLGTEDLSLLEHSLEKVKENNARIMENIQMLNRTLNYTKKKEILDIVCPKTMRSYPCNTCGKCFVYETGLRRHYAMRHAMTTMQPRWQVVWTCIQCFQVWPRQDHALNHSTECCKSDSTDCVREIKTSSLLQCEFCEKVYTSIPRLLRHSKAHTTSTNYECNACQMAFSSYKTAEQHWDSCPWMKNYYNFSLPKLLLCNACDRKFRNYEQLYNHRYKVDHFMTKTYCNPYSIKTLGILVYQCELCGAWYPSAGLLKGHKLQYHPKHDMECQMERNVSDQNYYTSLENEFSVGQNEDGNIQIHSA